MKIRGQKKRGEKGELNMTSMIDIVFLLLIFFVLTFKVVEQEGDFSIRMPLAGGGQPTEDLDLPLKLRLRADAEGNLTGMSLNDTDLGVDFDQLRGNVVGLIGVAAPTGDPSDGGPELEIDTDYDLRYKHVIEAITAVSGYKEGDQVVKLIEKIKFAKPRR